MERVRKQVGYEKAEELGLTGRGIGIGVLDTGVNPHIDFGNRILAFRDFIYSRGKMYDDSGHGTHVCGILAGNGQLSGGRYKGMAPEANLVVGKILDKNGNGEVEDLIKGVRWLLSTGAKYNLKVINISIGAKLKEEDQKREEKQKDILRMVEEVYEAGIVLVCAAGNFGPAPMSISTVGSMKHVISVGCHDGSFVLPNKRMCEEYSSRGPSRYAIKKPDIVAPGTEITSCCAGKKRYTRKSGTSMSTPIVSGAAALAMERFPNKSNAEIMQKLAYSSEDLQEPWTKQGWGMLNLRKFLQ